MRMTDAFNSFTASLAGAAIFFAALSAAPLHAFEPPDGSSALGELRAAVSRARDLDGSGDPGLERESVLAVRDVFRRAASRGADAGVAEMAREFEQLDFAALAGVPGDDGADRYGDLIARIDMLAARDALLGQMRASGAEEATAMDGNGAFGSSAAFAPGPPAAEEKRPGFASGPFCTHILDAMKINRSRSDHYSNVTGGGSKAVTRMLLWMERASLPLAIIMDRRAAKFIEKGVPVVAGDFVPMSAIPPAETAPAYRSVASKAALASLDSTLEIYSSSIGSALEAKDLAAVAKASAEAIGRIGALEKAYSCHFALSKHIAESIGYAARNGIAYAAASKGATAGLTLDLIKVQRIALVFCRRIDSAAQRSHAMDAGILVNDVPRIPFPEAVSGSRK